MVDYSLFNMKNNIKILSNNCIENDKWFIGSAIMAHDIRKLGIGSYYFNQSTIWARSINIDRINPYWEIYNNIDTYIFKNLCDLKLEKIFINFLDFFLENMTLNKEHLIFISSDYNFINMLKKYGFKYFEEEIKFKLEDRIVGTYSKLYYLYEGKYYPLIDFTHFKLDENIYNEISINKYYLELFEYKSKGIKPNKIKLFEKIYKKNFEFDDFYKLDYYRFIALLDTVNFINRYNIKISSNYKGHILKKILKDLVFYSILNDIDLNIFLDEVLLNYKEYVIKEMNKIKNFNMEVIEKYDLEFLKNTYGIDEKIIEYKKGVLKYKILKLNLNELLYFTDFPFLKEDISVSDFIIYIKKIIERKG